MEVGGGAGRAAGWISAPAGGIESRLVIGSGVDGRLIRVQSTRLSCAAPWIVEGRGNGENDLVTLQCEFLVLGKGRHMYLGIWQWGGVSSYRKCYLADCSVLVLA